MTDDKRASDPTGESHKQRSRRDQAQLPLAGKGSGLDTLGEEQESAWKSRRKRSDEVKHH